MKHVKVRGVGNNKSIEIKRMIGEFVSLKAKCPTLIFIGGIHGNEPAGVIALHNFCEKIKTLQIKLNANIYALAGNLSALEQNVRFLDEDLNRLWIEDSNFIKGKPGSEKLNNEQVELLELNSIIQNILSKQSGPFYFFDLHTTSSTSIAFATINDTIINRRLAINYPIPIILGIEEFIEGPLLSYINHLGHVAIGFEAGQHDDPNSALKHEALIWLTFNQLKLLKKSDIPDYDFHFSVLTGDVTLGKQVFDILYLYKIQEYELFEMVPGFKNFHAINKGEILGRNQNGEIKSEIKGRILMPKYQDQGTDGYFITRRIPKVWLYTSTFMRRLKLENIVALLPGVTKVKGESHTLQVNLNVARFFATDFFHLLGYRRKLKAENSMIFKKREHDFKSVSK